MSKIPCRKCNGCGLYHDLTVLTCSECGKDISSVPALLIETEEIPVEYYGEIDENITVYVQKCSACGALNFTADANKRVRVCCNCHKTRVAAIAPTLYTTRQKQDDDTAQDDSDEIKGLNGIDEIKTSKYMGSKEAKNASPKIKSNIVPITSEDEDDEDDDDDSAQWNSLLGNIRKAMGSPTDIPQPYADSSSRDNSVVKPTVDFNPSGKINDEDDEDDDDDDDVSDWSGILGGKSEPRKRQPQQEKPGITLTALRYGRLSFSLKPESDSPYLLGRSANQSTFLSNDRRVGNEHCYLVFKAGKWYVKDNHSSNGTAVNSRDIGLNGEHILADGDELKLGHHPDSMAFRITIT